MDPTRTMYICKCPHCRIMYPNGRKYNTMRTIHAHFDKYIKPTLIYDIPAIADLPVVCRPTTPPLAVPTTSKETDSRGRSDAMFDPVDDTTAAKSKVPDLRRFNNTDFRHFPIFIDKPVACENCKPLNRPNSHNRTTVLCEGCEVPLCFNRERNCFNEYHDLDKYLQEQSKK